MFFIRLTRAVPLIGILIVLALIIYFVALFRFPSAKAKHIVIQFFMWVCSILSGVFLLITLYGLIDKNVFAAELFGSFLVVTGLGLIITLIVRWRFFKKYPQYKLKPQETEEPQRSEIDWAGFLAKIIEGFFNSKRPIH